MKKLYEKFSPLAAKISRWALLVTAVCLVAATVMIGTLTDPWAVYYASLAQWFLIRIVIIAAVLFVLLDICPIWRFLKERIRKFIVMLKRNPSIIPLVMLFVCFLYYSLNLTHMSNTTALIQGKGMGLSQFCIMLFNLLSLVCMLNAFPRRKKPNIPMLVVLAVMFGILIYCDIHYLNGIAAALNRAESPIKIDVNTAYIAKAFNMLATYQTLLIITAALVVLLPVYSRLLKKIKTSVEVEDNGAMAEIEISD